MGRPSKFSGKLVDKICARLIEGESLRSICRDPKMASLGTVMRWLRENENFQQQYAHAREAQADTLADEIIDIADDSMLDTTTTEDGREIANSEWINRSRLRVDARKWVASKLKPKKYGDRLDVEHSGNVSVNMVNDLETARKAALTK